MQAALVVMVEPDLSSVRFVASPAMGNMIQMGAVIVVRSVPV